MRRLIERFIWWAFHALHLYQYPRLYDWFMGWWYEEPNWEGIQEDDSVLFDLEE